ncbi:MAG: glycosyltransferase [Pirellulaceae bacterium]|nr:glycosyltransferase [Pirellulaceae bacterium]
MLVHLVILNREGPALLAECLPSVVRAARRSRHRCDVTVIDNDSSDDSVAWLAEHFPSVQVIRRPNRGRCGHNEIVGTLSGRIAVLLDGDVRLAEDGIDPLVEPLLAEQSDCFMTAPMCRRSDETGYEGFRMAVAWGWGLVRPTAHFPGHAAMIDRPGPTASAGKVMAIDCRKFLELGGFDPLYLPGPFEDFDFAFRGFLRGYWACYVPESLCWHDGPATVGEPTGRENGDHLALRNTLLFEWRNVRHPMHVARCLLGLLARWGLEVATMPWASPDRRWVLHGALAAAVRRYCQCRPAAGANSNADLEFVDRGRRLKAMLRREREFFQRFSPERMADATAKECGMIPPTASRNTAARPAISGPKFHAASRESCRTR